jgi:hypothetical protein
MYGVWIHLEWTYHAFPLDSLERVTRSLGGSPRQMRARQHMRVQGCAIGRGQIKNHPAPRDRPSQTLPGGSKARV